MKIHIFCISLFLQITLFVFTQEAVTIPERTPEQEAASQTERLQRELNLTTEQMKDVYDINLNYARQRQHSNSRAEATQRIRNKNEDLKQVLSSEQYDKLHNKHFNYSNFNKSNNASETVRQSSGVTMQRSTKETRDRRNIENTANGHLATPPKRQSTSKSATSIMNNRVYYNNESSAIPSSGSRSSSSSYQQRTPSSSNYNKSQSSTSSRSSGSYSAPSSSGNSRSSSGIRSSGNSGGSNSGSSTSNTRKQ